MKMKGTQLWVRHESGRTANVVQGIEPHLVMFGALPYAPDGKVISAGDGTVEIRVMNSSATSMVKALLADQQLVVERELENES